MEERPSIHSLSKDLWKYIVHVMGNDIRTKRAFISSFPKLFRLYSSEERYILFNVKPAITNNVDGKQQCPACLAWVFNTRYASHISRCFPVVSKAVNLCRNNCENKGIVVGFPWHMKNIPCPFFKCIHCGNDVNPKHSRFDSYFGCTVCKHYVCNIQYCSMCDHNMPLCHFKEHPCITQDIPYMISIVKKWWLGCVSYEIVYDMHDVFVSVTLENGMEYIYVPVTQYGYTQFFASFKKHSKWIYNACMVVLISIENLIARKQSRKDLVLYTANMVLKNFKRHYK